MKTQWFYAFEYTASLFCIKGTFRRCRPVCLLNWPWLQDILMYESPLQSGKTLYVCFVILYLYTVQIQSCALNVIPFCVNLCVSLCVGKCTQGCQRTTSVTGSGLQLLWDKIYNRVNLLYLSTYQACELLVILLSLLPISRTYWLLL